MWFSEVLPLDKFEVVDGKLTFENLAARSGATQRQFAVRWASWNKEGHSTPLPASGGARMPAFPADTQYLQATITETTNGEADDPVTIYLRREPTGIRVIGIDR